MFRLRGVYQNQVSEFLVDTAATMIGRDPRNKIHLDQPTISRHHALLEMEGDQLFVTDQNSDNGTYLNGKKLAPGERTAVEPGDELQIADRVLNIHEDEPAFVGKTLALGKDAKHPHGRVMAFSPDPVRPSKLDDTLVGGEREEEASDEIARGASLKVRSASPHELPVAISGPEMLIGRGRKAHLRLADKAASKIHARIVRRNQRYYIYDDNSLNGLYVNGDKVRGVELCHRDVLVIGHTVIEFLDPTSPTVKADREQIERKVAALVDPDRSLPLERDLTKVLILAGSLVVAVIATVLVMIRALG